MWRKMGAAHFAHVPCTSIAAPILLAFHTDEGSFHPASIHLCCPLYRKEINVSIGDSCFFVPGTVRVCAELISGLFEENQDKFSLQFAFAATGKDGGYVVSQDEFGGKSEIIRQNGRLPRPQDSDNVFEKRQETIGCIEQNDRIWDLLEICQLAPAFLLFGGGKAVEEEALQGNSTNRKGG